jgi:uroporphyrin-III C-methyltransferase
MNKRGKVYLVGAGPGDPELLTVKALKLLQTADAVLHDDLVPQAVLALANPTAFVLSVGKRCGLRKVTQQQIHSLMITAAHGGFNVVRLKSGDPMIFGRAQEEMDALRSAGVALDIVPGITAAFAAAAAAQCSLTDRRSAGTVTFSSGHHAESEASVQEPHGQTHCIYMPGGRLRELADNLLRQGEPLSLPCVLVSFASQPEQQVIHTTLEHLASLVPGASPSILLAGPTFIARTSPQDSLDSQVSALFSEAFQTSQLPLQIQEER